LTVFLKQDLINIDAAAAGHELDCGSPGAACVADLRANFE